jgi:hypothetical protein
MQSAYATRESEKHTSRRAKAWTVLPPLFLAGFSLILAAKVKLEPSDPTRVAAVFAPWWSPEQSLLAAASAGRIVEVAGAHILVVSSTEKDLAARLKAAGAIAVVESKFAAYCGSIPWRAGNAG